MNFALSCLLAATLFDTPAAPPEKAGPTEDVQKFLDAWAKKSRDIRSLVLRFRQEKTLRILRRPKVSSGDLAYADGKLSVVVRGKDGEVESELLLKDGALKIHYPRLQRLEVIDVGANPAGPGMGPSIPFFAGDPRDAEKDYEVKLLRGEKEDVVTLVPRDSKSPVKRLELVLVDFELREYRQIDASGDELRMTIQSSEVNARVPPERFELRIPPGTQETKLNPRSPKN